MYGFIYTCPIFVSFGTCLTCSCENGVVVSRSTTPSGSISPSQSMTASASMSESSSVSNTPDPSFTATAAPTAAVVAAAIRLSHADATETMNIVEVQVFGVQTPDVEEAQLGTATASSSLVTNFIDSFDPVFAIDGRIDPSDGAGWILWHSDFGDPSPWLLITLAQPVMVRRLRVYLRGSFEYRDIGDLIEVLDAAGVAVFSAVITADSISRDEASRPYVEFINPAITPTSSATTSVSSSASATPSSTPSASPAWGSLNKEAALTCPPGEACVAASSFCRADPADTVRQQLSVVAAGSRHACAIDSVGDLRCWGDNAYGQAPRMPVKGPFRHVATTEDCTCALTNGGHIRCFGNTAGPSCPASLGPAEGVQFIHFAMAPSAPLCAVTSGNTVTCYQPLASPSSEYSQHWDILCKHSLTSAGYQPNLNYYRPVLSRLLQARLPRLSPIPTIARSV